MIPVGIFLCGYIVGENTGERKFRRGTTADGLRRPKTEMLWLQPGGQVVVDHVFDAFAYGDRDQPLEKYITSSKQFRNFINPRILWAAIFFAVFGFIFQFVGLRAMHAWASLAHLLALLIMSITHPLLRSHRLGRAQNLYANKGPGEKPRDISHMVVGYELDHLALQLASSSEHAPRAFDTKGPFSSWLLLKGSDDGKVALFPTIHDPTDATAHGATYSGLTSDKDDKPMLVYGSTLSQYPEHIHSSQQKSPSSGRRVFWYRRRLAQLTALGQNVTGSRSKRAEKGWQNEHVLVRDKAQQLSKAIESATRFVFSPDSRFYFSGRWNHTLSFCWALDIEVGYSDHSHKERVYLCLRRPSKDSLDWTIDATDIEAILGLHMWSITNEKLLTQHDDSIDARKSTLQNVPVFRLNALGYTLRHGMTQEYHDRSEFLTTLEMKMSKVAENARDDDLLIGDAWVKLSRPSAVVPSDRPHRPWIPSPTSTTGPCLYFGRTSFQAIMDSQGLLCLEDLICSHVPSTPLNEPLNLSAQEALTSFLHFELS